MEYFSDGLTDELLNSLTEINELQVAARTSAFSFKGTNTDIGTIARKLNVGAVSRRERPAFRAHHPHQRSVDQCRHGLFSPVVEDL